MFDDVLKGSKASKKNKAEEVKSASPEIKNEPPTEKQDLDVVTTTAPKKRKSTGKRTDPTYKQVGGLYQKRYLLTNPETIAG